MFWSLLVAYTQLYFQFRWWFAKQKNIMALTFFKVFFQARACTQKTASSATDNRPIVQHISLLCKTYLRRKIWIHLCQYINIIFLRNRMKRHTGFSSERSILWSALLDLWCHFSPQQDHTPFYFSQFGFSALLTLELYRVRHKNISQFAVCLYMAIPMVILQMISPEQRK